MLSCNSEQDKKITNDSTINQNNYSKDSIIGRGTFLTDKELAYIKTRDRYIEYFEKPKDPNFSFEQLEKQNKDSLLELERLLKVILKDSRVGDGRINLEALYDEGENGFGMLDGLVNGRDPLNLFGITKNLFFYYFMNNKINQLDQLTSNDFNKILTSAFTNDAAITALTTIKLPSENNVQAYGIVTYEAQDIGPFPPNRIYIFVVNDKYVYMASEKLEAKLTEVKECRKIWDSLIEKTGAADDMGDYAQNKYCECCQQGYQNEPQFDSIKKEIVDIVNYLEH